MSTGDERNGGTDARVFIILHAGKDGKEKTSGKIWLDNGSFERNKTDIFEIDVATLLSPVSKIEIGHDNKGLGPGWFLDRVVVLCYATGIEQVFQCGKWLATDQEDGLIQRTLYEQKAVRKQREKSKLVDFGFMVFNATFNNVSVISWRSVLMVEETGENH